MRRKTPEAISNNSLILIIFSFWAVFLLFNLYYLLDILNFTQQFNQIDLSLIAAWQHRFFYPKNDLKLFYLLGIITIPSFSILLTHLFALRIPNPFLMLKQTTIAISFFLIFSHLLGFHSPTQLIIINLATVILFFLSKYLPSINFPDIPVFFTRQFNSVLELYRPYRPSISRYLKYITRYHLFIVTAMLFLILWNFAYKYDTGIWYNYYHHNFLIATINDLLHGKTILVDTFNQYGLLFPLSLSAIFRHLLPLSYMNLYLIFMIFTLIYYMVLYYLLLKLTSNKPFSLLGIFLIAGVNFLFNYKVFPYSENYAWPGATVLRYFPDIFLFLTLLSNTNLRFHRKYWLSCLIAIYALFHNFEFGLSLLFSFFFLLLYPILLNRDSYSPRLIIRSLFRFAIPLLLTGVLGMSLFYLYTLSSSGQLPNWNLFFKFSYLYQSGLSNAKTPLIGWYIFPLGLYLGVITKVLYLSIKKHTISWKWQVLSSYSLYGLLTLNYYFSRSYYSNLWIIVIPAMVIFLVILLDLSKLRKLRYLFIPLVIFAFFIGTLSTYYLVKKVNYRLYSTGQLLRLPKYENNRGFVVSYSAPLGYEAEELLRSVSTIKELVPSSQRIFLISRYDSVLMVMSERTNYLPFPLLEQIYFRSDVDSIRIMLSDKSKLPQYLFLDKHNPHEKLPELPMPHDILNEIIEYVNDDYVYLMSVGILDIYELNSGI